MRVVPVDSPGLQRAFHDEVVPRAPNVVHHLLATPFLKRFANPRAKRLQHLIPGSANPLPCSARSVALHRIQHAIRILNLIDGRRAFGTETPAARRMHRIALELGDLPGFFVDIGQQSAGRFTIETNRRNKLIMLLQSTGPRLGVEFNPVIPLFYRGTISEMAPVAFEIMIHSESPSILACRGSRLNC